MVDEDIVELCLALKYLLRGTSHVAVEGLKVVNVCHVDIELWVDLRVNVHRKNVFGQESGAVYYSCACRCRWGRREEREGREIREAGEGSGEGGKEGERKGEGAEEGKRKREKERGRRINTVYLH